MIRFLFLALALIALPAAALDVDVVRSITAMPNPSAHNAGLGAQEQTNGGSNIRINTATSTLVATGPAVVKHAIVVASTSGTVAVYDDASVPCDTNLRLPAFGLTAGGTPTLGVEVSSGLCLLTAGTIDAVFVYLP